MNPNSKPTLVVNRRREPFDVYIGRGSIWGNRFVHLITGRHQGVIVVATRDEAIDRYAEWIMTQPQLLARLPELRGKRLGCYCAPLRCHGEILADLADALPG
jgi:hypothetical protein